MNAPDVTIKRGIINGQLFDIMSYEQYAKYDYKESSMGVTAEVDGKEVVLPYRGKDTSGTLPGIYNAGPIDFCVYPDSKSVDHYCPRKIIEMGNTESMKELLAKEDIMSRMDEPWITSPDNITYFPIAEDDQPEMICLKSALNAKKIDFDKYSARFGDNFPNDKRQLKNNSVTLNIIKRFCDKCDMEAILILRDKTPRVPNPMNTEVSVSLTDAYFGDEES